MKNCCSCNRIVAIPKVKNVLNINPHICYLRCFSSFCFSSCFYFIPFNEYSCFAARADGFIIVNLHTIYGYR